VAMTHRRWMLALTAATLLGSAGCGGSGGAAAQPSASASAGFSAYADCLRGQGIAVPEGFGSDRPSGGPRPGRSGYPSGRPTAFPSGRPSVRPSGQPGGRFGELRPTGVDDATWQKAQEACRGSLPTRRTGASGAPGGRGGNAAYRNCLADHGVQLAPGLNTADPLVAAAMKTCAVLNATGTPRPAAS
jgi:hypothetical protein